MAVSVPTNWGFVTGAERGRTQGQALNVTREWQNQRLIDLWVCFKWGEKEFCLFFRHFWWDGEVTSLTGMLLQLLKKGEAHLAAACISRRDFLPDIRLKSLCCSSDIILALALFRCRFWLWGGILCEHCVGEGVCFDGHYPHCWCGDISSLEVLLSIRFITVITAIEAYLVKCALLSAMYFLPKWETVQW